MRLEFSDLAGLIAAKVKGDTKVSAEILGEIIGQISLQCDVKIIGAAALARDDDFFEIEKAG